MLIGSQVNLFADDVEPAVAFYGALGFEERYRSPAHGAPLHVELFGGGLTVGISSVRAALEEHGVEVSAEGAAVEIALWCDDAVAAYAAALGAGAAPLRAPYESQGGRLIIGRVLDPLGNPLAFIEERDVASD